MTFADVPNERVGMPSLMDGEYDEGESHNGFLEALQAWRNSGKSKEEQQKEKKKVTQNDVAKSWKHQ